MKIRPIHQYFSIKYVLYIFLILPQLFCHSTNSFEREKSHVEDRCLRIYSGYDQRTRIGFHVCQESILQHSSSPVSFTPLDLRTLKGIYTRPREPDQLTDFTFTRFLVPYLSDYKGWSLFIDGNDMLIRDDIAKLFAMRDDRFAVMVVKHPQFTDEDHTFMGNTIKTYPMFNWSSVMLFNNAKCKKLTPELVNTAKRLDLHQFKWLESPELIGELPSGWNHLVGYYEPRPGVSLVHWTKGAPFQGDEFAKTEYTEEWFNMELHVKERLPVPKT